MVALRNYNSLVSDRTFVIIKGPVMIIAIVVSALLIAYLAVSAYIARSIMKVPRLPLGDTPASVGLAYEDVSFPSRIDRLTLKGWYIAGKKAFTVIIVTGMHQSRVDYSISVLNMTGDLAERATMCSCSTCGAGANLKAMGHC